MLIKQGLFIGLLKPDRWARPMLRLVLLLVSSLFCTVVTTLVSWAATEQGGAQAQEYPVKAAMMYKFLSFTAWPETVFQSKESPYKIWVIGSREIGTELRTLTSDRTANDRPIKVVNTQSLKKVSQPHVVFVGRNAEKHLPRIAKLAEQHSFLIITENEQGLKAGSTINMRVVNDRVGFEVSLACAQRYDIQLSSRLLSVASSVNQVGC